MSLLRDLSFALVLGFPLTVGLSFGAVALTRRWTNQPSPRRTVSRAGTLVAATTSSLAAIVSFGIWTFGFNWEEERFPPAVDQALWTGQALSGAGLLLALAGVGWAGMQHAREPMRPAPPVH